MAANPTATTRLRPINHAYLEALGKLGPYGKGKAGVMRRFIENGIADAVEKKVVPQLNPDDFEDDANDEEDD